MAPRCAVSLASLARSTAPELKSMKARDVKTPKNSKEAGQSKLAHKWRAADAVELKQLLDKGVLKQIHKGDIPPTIGVFVTPGTRLDGSYPEQRSLEYDTVSDVYASFLQTNILPLVSAEYNISTDPAMRMAAG